MKQQAEIFCQHKRGVASLKIFWFTLAAAARQCWPALLSTEWRTGVDIWEDSWNIWISILWKEELGWLSWLPLSLRHWHGRTDLPYLRTVTQGHLLCSTTSMCKGKLKGGWCAVTSCHQNMEPWPPWSWSMPVYLVKSQSVAILVTGARPALQTRAGTSPAPLPPRRQPSCWPQTWRPCLMIRIKLELVSAKSSLTGCLILKTSCQWRSFGQVS